LNDGDVDDSLERVVVHTPVKQVLHSGDDCFVAGSRRIVPPRRAVIVEFILNIFIRSYEVDALENVVDINLIYVVVRVFGIVRPLFPLVEAAHLVDELLHRDELLVTLLLRTGKCGRYHICLVALFGCFVWLLGAFRYNLASRFNFIPYYHNDKYIFILLQWKCLAKYGKNADLSIVSLRPILRYNLILLVN